MLEVVVVMVGDVVVVIGGRLRPVDTGVVIGAAAGVSIIPSACDGEW